MQIFSEKASSIIIPSARTHNDYTMTYNIISFRRLLETSFDALFDFLNTVALY